MGLIIGIDAGGSTTKIVGVNANREIIAPIFIKAADPVTSLFGAFGKFLHDNGLQLSDIEHIRITGVGSAYIETPIYGIPTTHVDEFTADGLGAGKTTLLKRYIVVSMGTGTSFVQIDEKGIRHIGGIGLGGGSLVGLAKLTLNTDDIHQIIKMAESGNEANVNLQIGDISNRQLPNLPMHATASLFGKVSDNVSPNDVALGIIYAILQTIGVSTVLAALNSPIRDFVLIGNLARLPQCKRVFDELEQLYGVRFHIPEYAEFSTAIGAALSYFHD